MADVARAEALVHAMEQDESFRQEVESAPTMADKRRVLDEHGWQDVQFDDMRAYAESQGQTLYMKQGERELSDAELDAVVGGATGEEIGYYVGGTALALGALIGVAAIAAG